MKRISVLALKCALGILGSLHLVGCANGVTDPEGDALLIASAPGSDPFWSEQWYINNQGQTSYSKTAAVAGEDIHLGALHEADILGKGVRIAVSDTGVESSHEDLVDRILKEETKDYAPLSQQTQNGDPELSVNDSWTAHGTAVAGLIAATGWNGVGIRGVAPSASIANLRFIGVDIGLDDVLDQAGGDLDVYNYSYGFYPCEVSAMEPGLHATFQERVENGREGKGTIYVKAAGNEFEGDLANCVPSTNGSYAYFGNSNLDQSNTAPEIIVVGAVNAQGVKSSYSTPGSNLWVSAPGGEYGSTSPALITTDISGCRYGFSSNESYTWFDLGNYGNGACNYTNTMNGTSSATPLVSGVIALMLGVQPELTWREVKRILAVTARLVDLESVASISHPSANLNLTGHTYQRGWVKNQADRYFHNYYGFGVVDAAAAVQAAREFELGSLGEPVLTTAHTTSVQSIPDESSAGLSQTVTITQNLKIESVVVRVNITHTFASDLGIQLTSPSGTHSILMNINSGIVDSSLIDTRFLSNAFFEEESAGTWTLRVVDGYGQDVGTLDSWTLEVTGRSF